ncbi:eukaryotic translation initiation factor 4 gamma 3 [Diplodia corticola]|uniref:Eukaryotic translation initiation factor 4 gamma 3 n=1 Tax=Diplodia corticola TaxID=236234 RepID=A0A1J9R8Z9_9PEZI|nr:eukaryotic translation initiation factor 4 gamma 3 [Diplodia corticola]OJD36650.1 eukaryotic translation initiation factor 4 gamma 3 [Diplodia corticola]
MADVRAMLRAERAARNPPPARKPAQTAAPPASKNLKRKASDEDEEDWDPAAKRPRGPGGDGLPEGFFDPGAKPAAESRSIELTSRPASHDSLTTTAQPTPSEPAPIDTIAAQVPEPDVDEEEWAAFEREVAASPPREPPALAALKSAATIEAKPVTAEELAAQMENEQNRQRSRREEEMEAEKEDAVRHLEEEFDEMEELEQRVQRLRAQREALRQVRGQTEEAAIAGVPSKAAEDEEDESDDDLDDDEDFDDWRFRGA